MLLPSFEYERPETVEEAVHALASHRNARVLAGGQTLLNALKLRVIHPDKLVDVSRIAAMREIRDDGEGWLSVGAAVTYDEFAHSAVIQRFHPAAAAMSARIVDRQVRARGTIGGNVCLADPTSNFPPLVLALGAQLRVRGPNGARNVPAADFFLAPYMTNVAPGELLEAILLPKLGADQAVGYESLQVGTDSWALARACAVISSGDTIEAARIVLGCGPVPVRQPEMEQSLIGQEPTPEVVHVAAQKAGENLRAPSDVHASARYRTRMAKVVAARAVLSAVGRDGR